MMNNHLVSVEEALKHGVTGEDHDANILLKCSFPLRTLRYGSFLSHCDYLADLLVLMC